MDPLDPFDTSNNVKRQTSADDGRSSDQTLLTLPDEEAAEQMIREWDDSLKDIKNYLAQWKVNKARSQGYTGIRMIKMQDEQRAYFPMGASPSGTAMNKAVRLKRRLRALLFADPPRAECQPSSDQDDDRDNAEFATRVLTDVSSEGQLDYGLLAGDAFDLAGDYGSGFIRFWTDPKGGGWRPEEIQAHPQAQTRADAEIDPNTGFPANSDVLITRFVKQDDTLTDDRLDPTIAMQWLPRLQTELLSGKHVRFIPFTARDVWDAEAVMIGAMVPLGVVKSLFPDVAQLDDKQLAELVNSRPANTKDLLPVGRRDTSSDIVGDKSLVFVLTRYHRQCAYYPKGFYGIVIGADYLAHRQEWYDDTNGQPLEIPITQFKHFVDEDNPYGRGMMEFLGPGNELRAMMLGAMLEHLDRFTHRKTFVPMHSNLQPQQLQAETGTYLPMVPNGAPVYEQVPDFPIVVEKMWERTTADLDDESGLQQVAQGVNSPSVQSGQHAYAIIEQVNQALSDLREHTERGLVRGWRIMLQQIRAFYTVSQKIHWVGEDGAYKLKSWSGADLGDTTDVRMARGSFSSLGPTQKAGLIQTYAQAGFITLEDARHLTTGAVQGLIGLQDDPHRMRVRRQIARWKEGPPAGWRPPMPQLDPATGQPAMDPNTGQPAVPPDPLLSDIFAPLPCDEEPNIAHVHTYELGRAVASQHLWRFPPEWRMGLLTEYERMRHAAGIQTIAEQQQAAQAQAQAQQQAQQQQQQAQLQQQQQQASQQQEGEAVKMDHENKKLEFEREKTFADHQLEREKAHLTFQKELAEAKAKSQVQHVIVPPEMPSFDVERDAQGRIIRVVPQSAGAGATQ